MIGLREYFSYNERLASIASHVMVLLLVSCLAINTIALGERVLYGWDSSGLLIVCILLSVEAVFSFRLTMHMPVSDSKKKVTYRITEIIIILLILKIFTELHLGWKGLLQNVVLWQEDFPTYLLTSSYIVNVLIGAIAWTSSIYFASDLWNLEGISDALEGYSPISDRKSIHDKIAQRYLGIGVALTLITGALQQDVVAFPGKFNGSNIPITVLLIYFLTGLVLLSLSRFANLQGKWAFEKTRIQKNISFNWVFYSSIFLITITAVSIFLPTGYSFKLLEAIKLIASWISAFIRFLGALLLLLFSLIARGLFPENNATVPDSQQIDEPQIQNLLPKPEIQGIPLLDAVKTLLFWVILLVVLIYAFKQYLQTNKGFAQILRQFTPFRWMLSLWSWFTKQSRHIRYQMINALGNEIKRIKSLITKNRDKKEKWRYLNLRRLTPRQRIYFYYHALLMRADEAGIPRHDWQTPLEYSSELFVGRPKEQESIVSLTDSFMDARYTKHNISTEKVDQTKKAWDNIRRFFQIGKRSKVKKTISDF